MDFDVQIIRADGVELYRSIQISDPSTHAPTQLLVDSIEELGLSRIKLILTAAAHVLRGPHVRLDVEHTFHLHVRLL
jgi:hypothetical protein